MTASNIDYFEWVSCKHPLTNQQTRQGVGMQLKVHVVCKADGTPFLLNS
jgi:hypothetical protein